MHTHLLCRALSGDRIWKHDSQKVTKSQNDDKQQNYYLER